MNNQQSDTNFNFDKELREVEEFIQQVHSGKVDTSTAMSEYRDRHRPTIDRLERELKRFRGMLAEGQSTEPDDDVPF